MFCVQCGQSMGDGSAFCPACGRPTGIGPSGQYPPPYPPHAAYVPYVPPPRPRFVDPVTGRPLAEWWRRLLAYLLDGLIVTIPSYLTYQAVLIAKFSSFQFPQDCQQQYPPNNCGNEIFHSFFATIWITVLVYVIVQFVFGALYFSLFIGARRGQTIGMMALSIAVRDEREDVTIGRRRALTRWFVLFILGIPFGILALIDCLAPLWDRRRQSWHDHAAGSVVVDVE